MLRGGPGGRTSRTRIAAAMTMTMTAMTLGGCVDRGPGTPQETVTEAAGSYPPRVEEPTDGFEVALPSIPLLADDRLRVLGAEDRVWAEPLEAPEDPPAYWSYARDSTLNTIAVADRPGDAPLVVSLWSDGALIAVDARTGAVDWRAESPRSPGGGWSDRRDPDEDDRLLIVPGGGSPVALVARLGGLWAFDAGDGRPLWEREWSCGESGRQWAASHAVVVQEYCEQERIRTFHPRTGEEISVLEPEMPPSGRPPTSPASSSPAST
ncbi:PQQ-binding-like beta-propeller repeat protein [Streptomyces sodiiphilus]